MEKFMKHSDDNLHYELKAGHRSLCVTLVIVGVIAAGISMMVNPKHTWVTILANNYYFTTLALVALFFVALQYVAGAHWADSLRRLPEAMAAYLPVGAVLMFVLYFGMHDLYHWSHAEAVVHDELLRIKSPYLNVTSYFVRMAIILGLWTLFATLLRHGSYAEDAHCNTVYRKRNTILSCLFMIVFAYSLSIASTDWLMSVNPHWFSTMYGVYCFSGIFVAAVAAITLMAVLLQEQGYLKQVNENHYHDLGKLLFAFSMFWAYIWFCQFMLIWYGNIPEETMYYHTRLKGDWDWLFYFNFVINFVVPFFVLMPRAAKRSAAILKRVSIVLLVGHWLDIYLLIMPDVATGTVAIGMLDVLITFGYAGLFVLVSALALAKAKLMPTGSPVLALSLHHHQ